MINKKGISTIITTMIMIGLALTSIGIIYVVVQNILSEQQEEISSGLSRIMLNIIEDSVKFSGGQVSLVISRDTGKGDLSKIKIIVYNEEGESDSEDVDASDLGQLEKKRFAMSTSFTQINKIAIAPIIKTSSGRESLQAIVDAYTLSVPLGSSENSEILNEENSEILNEENSESEILDEIPEENTEESVE